MSTFSAILTHPGSAHKDEFLACCVLLAEAASPVPIHRREPTDADLADAGPPADARAPAHRGVVPDAAR